MNLKEELKTEIRMALGRGYCTPENEKKELDIVLLNACAEEIFPIFESKLSQQREETIRECINVCMIEISRYATDTETATIYAIGEVVEELQSKLEKK